nr:MAG TPA: hypothetical protein [Caudoviricetes sp.]
MGAPEGVSQENRALPGNKGGRVREGPVPVRPLRTPHRHLCRKHPAQEASRHGRHQGPIHQQPS